MELADEVLMPASQSGFGEMVKEARWQTCRLVKGRRRRPIALVSEGGSLLPTPSQLKCCEACSLQHQNP